MTNQTVVSAMPQKSFFVEMLTRDISLPDSILDLLDNCIDGILRSHLNHQGDRPYEGFQANISFDETFFKISDNCGGIPINLTSYAFRMGRDQNRPDEAEGSVGVYGIGMKRAIFKMGRHCDITSWTGHEGFKLSFTHDWMNSSDWDIPINKFDGVGSTENGTTIFIKELKPAISEYFCSDFTTFESDLIEMISTQYAFIIDKGFSVIINDKMVMPKPTKLLFAEGKEAIAPYIFKTEIDDVNVEIVVGFTGATPSMEELEEEVSTSSHNTKMAGWTILCNDRAVVYCNRDELTGWGEAGIPRYHTQFIAVSGIVSFRSKDPRKLPTNTTKRGIDASSLLYLRAKNKMREGMRIFIDYTNKWKGRAEEARIKTQAASPFKFNEIMKKSEKIQFRDMSDVYFSGKEFKPDLPKPPREAPNTKHISYEVTPKEFNKVAEYLEQPNISARDLGLECFKIVLKDAE